LKAVTPLTIDYVGPTLTLSLNGSGVEESNPRQLIVDFESGT
jgi:hypothetical protein